MSGNGERSVEPDTYEDVSDNELGANVAGFSQNLEETSAPDDSRAGDPLSALLSASLSSFDSLLSNSEGSVGSTEEGNLGAEFGVEFNVLDAEELKNARAAIIEDVTGVLKIPPEHAALVLRLYAWDSDAMLEGYLEDAETSLQKVGLHSDFNEDKEEPAKPVANYNAEELGLSEAHEMVEIGEPGFVCLICYTEVTEGSKERVYTFGLKCGHKCCLGCFRDYLAHKIMQDRVAESIVCPSNDAKCKTVVDERAIKCVLGPVGTPCRDMFEVLLLQAFVAQQPTLKWCPAPKCEYVVECLVPRTMFTRVVPSVICKCGHKFCFGCKRKSHFPCPCDLIEKWAVISKDSSMSAMWLTKNTKDCPKCAATIQKNGGCNHMTCVKCSHQFCWVCLKDWSLHDNNYDCNLFRGDPNLASPESPQQGSSTGSSSSLGNANLTSRRQLFARYTHYYSRFKNHIESASLTLNLVSKMKKNISTIAKSQGSSWIEAQFLRRALVAIVTCRETLQWTYVLAFYLDPKDIETAIFEAIQRDLELAVEQLTSLVETPILPDQLEEKRHIIVNKVVYVQCRRQVLVRDVSRGLLNQRWKFVNQDLTQISALR